jgi:hypothetical protein
LPGLWSTPTAGGVGDSPQAVLLETPPHPNPLPASGERERAILLAFDVQLDFIML